MSFQSGTPLWVDFMLNGDSDTQHAVKVNINNIKDLPGLFQYAVEKLLPQTSPQPCPLTRVFSHEGIEIHKIQEVYPDDRLFFSCGEDFFTHQTPSPSSLDQQQQQQQQQQGGNGYLYTTGLWTSAIVSTAYGYFSHTVRTHTPSSVAQTFDSIENTVSSYSQPLVQSTIPYISSSITWSDQMLNQAIATTSHQTGVFLATPAGQRATAITHNVADYASKAVQSFKTATTGNPAPQPTPANGNQNQKPSTDLQQSQAEQHQQSYLDDLKTRLGTGWNETMLPWAMDAYSHLTASYSQNDGTPATGANSPSPVGETYQPPQ